MTATAGLDKSIGAASSWVALTSGVLNMPSNPNIARCSRGAAVVLVLLLAGGASVFAQGNPLAELLRKVEAREQENGFCATVSWPRGDDRAGYVRWLEGAQVGTSKLNTFATGQCQYDE